MLRSSLALSAVLAGGVAKAGPDPQIATYAIVVGSNAGGPGQTDLRYAEDDARRVGAVLTELGGYPNTRVDIVVHPTPDQLRDRIAKLGDQIEADAAAGRQSRVFFYYSGHARASAIDLGAAELPLAELRERLFKVPATLTVVVLDACQSGAFSRVKGAKPAADFSFNSRQHLDATGVAVLASSSGSELSQESEQLRSSYFTHHLLVGLRGAGDANGDGQVSLDEAYRYAYHQTLLATSETAVGGQHVTFEADLKGHGEVPLSFPRAATSAIILPSSLEGQLLVEDKRAHAVIAETYKAKGAAVRIAVASGDYEVIVRHGRSLSRCDVAGGGTVDLDHCRTEAIATGTTKGGGFVRPTRLEVGAFAGPERHDDYTANLDTFGYQEEAIAPSTGLSIVGLRRWTQRIWVGAGTEFTMMPHWTHHVIGSDLHQQLQWNTTEIRAIVRAEQAIAESGPLRFGSVFAQLAGGLGVGRTILKGADGTVFTDTHFGPAFAVAAGIHGRSAWIPGLGATIGYELDYAPIIKDLIGNTHASGGHRLAGALTYSF